MITSDKSARQDDNEDDIKQIKKEMFNGASDTALVLPRPPSVVYKPLTRIASCKRVRTTWSKRTLYVPVLYTVLPQLVRPTLALDMRQSSRALKSSGTPHTWPVGVQ